LSSIVNLLFSHKGVLKDRNIAAEWMADFLFELSRQTICSVLMHSGSKSQHRLLTVQDLLESFFMDDKVSPPSSSMLSCLRTEVPRFLAETIRNLSLEIEENYEIYFQILLCEQFNRKETMFRSVVGCDIDWIETHSKSSNLFTELSSILFVSFFVAFACDKNGISDEQKRISSNFVYSLVEIGISLGCKSFVEYFGLLLERTALCENLFEVELSRYLFNDYFQHYLFMGSSTSFVLSLDFEKSIDSARNERKILEEEKTKKDPERNGRFSSTFQGFPSFLYSFARLPRFSTALSERLMLICLQWFDDFLSRRVELPFPIQYMSKLASVQADWTDREKLFDEDMSSEKEVHDPKSLQRRNILFERIIRVAVLFPLSEKIHRKHCSIHDWHRCCDSNENFIEHDIHSMNVVDESDPCWNAIDTFLNRMHVAALEMLSKGIGTLGTQRVSISVEYLLNLLEAVVSYIGNSVYPSQLLEDPLHGTNKAANRLARTIGIIAAMPSYSATKNDQNVWMGLIEQMRSLPQTPLVRAVIAHQFYPKY